MNDAGSSKAGARGEFLTARQLAEILQVSESTVRRLAREGRIPSVRITSRLLRFRLDSVLLALDGANARRTSRRKSSEDSSEDAQLTFAEML